MRSSIGQIQRICTERADRWHDGDFRNWSTLEWAGAACGELGEAANVAKKIKRIEDGLTGNEVSDHAFLQDIAPLRAEVAKECADAFLYMCILLSSVEIDFEQAIVDRFNRKSEALGFPERIQ